MVRCLDCHNCYQPDLGKNEFKCLATGELIEDELVDKKPCKDYLSLSQSKQEDN